MRQIIGLLCVLAAGISFGFMPLFKRWVSDGDPNASTAMLMMLRFGIAAAFLWAVVIIGRLPIPRGKVLMGYILMGSIGYFGEAYCFFAALNHIPGGLVSLLLYTYPIFVTLGAWKIFGERLTVRLVIGLVVATAGLALTVGPAILQEGPRAATGVGGNRLLGIGLGLCTAISYGGYILCGAYLSKVQVGKEIGGGTGGIGSSLANSAVVLASTAAMFAIVCLAKGETIPTSPRAWQGISALAVFCSIIAIPSLLAGLAIVGPVKTAAVSLCEPVCTIAVGGLFLSETLGVWQWLGGALILVGAGVTIQPPREEVHAPSRGAAA